jgi:hypothetical protein
MKRSSWISAKICNGQNYKDYVTTSQQALQCGKRDNFHEHLLGGVQQSQQAIGAKETGIIKLFNG